MGLVYWRWPDARGLHFLTARFCIGSSLVRLFRSTPFLSVAPHCTRLLSSRRSERTRATGEGDPMFLRKETGPARDTLFARAVPLPRTILWAAPHLGILLFLFLHAAVSYDGSGTQVP